MKLFEDKLKNTEIRICKVSKSYLKFLNKIDYRIPVKSNRQFIGLAILINGKNYVVPLSSQTEDKRALNLKRKRSPIITTFLKENGVPLADILHNNMFPVPES